ncbi:DNA alkylation repair protein [Arthrobacter sp. CDRTa11]|uniref:DNA alkylation repair protein n=1 Tax=Arthrobacter sp. CDRTa11 TaxID=2651199 RepID=UPI002265DD9D|nr:DNA alkylation repair protein [Arthrobacter sp. CDRTa11]UZX04551.1 DNA alkylation repair protein [Arthrobacter sp. CDRTa11]
MGVMNELINAQGVESLAELLAEASPGKDWEHLAGAAAGLSPLGLRERTDHVSHALLEDLRQLPQPGYPTAARIFRSALRRPAFTGWVLWPVSEAAVTLALESGSDQDFDDCLALLAELTPRLTGEFAVRRLLARDQDRALRTIRHWTSHPDEHVRRLASEGTRAYLPWAVRVPSLIRTPEATLPILDALYRDPSEYVRRSVANHLNDLARHAPGVVVSTAARWLAAPDANTPGLVRQGLRTLIKKAHPEALALLGFAPASVTVTAPRLDRRVVTMPAELTFDFDVSNIGSTDARLAVDYVVHYLKANGSHSAKVFKMTSLTLGAGETKTLSKRHAFKPMTTRVHHPGVHALELQINGIRHSRTEFVLEAERVIP